MAKEVYDFIIVGGGVAGCVVAHRLSQANKSYKILLLEAGDDARDHESTQNVAEFPKLRGSPLDYSLDTTPQPHLKGRRLKQWGGKCLGGSGAINAAGWTRGPACDFDRWAQLTGDPDWSWERMLPYFRKAEAFFAKDSDCINQDLHGSDGPMKVFVQGRTESEYQMHDHIEKLWLDRGLRWNPDLNSGDALGLGYPGTLWNEGQRQFPQNAYDLSGVEVRLRTRVHKILFDDENLSPMPRARGVLTHDGETFLASQVIVAAGVYFTPQILMLSGIGRQEDLSRLGIETKILNESVGQHLRDDLNVRQVFRLRDPAKHGGSSRKPLRRLPLDHFAYLQCNSEKLIQALREDGEPDASRHWLLNAGRVHQEVYIMYLALLSGTQLQSLNIQQDGTYFTTSVYNMAPTARGEVRLASADPRQAPVVDPRYQSKAADREVMRDALRQVYQLLMFPIDESVQPITMEEVLLDKSHLPLTKQLTDDEIDSRIAYCAESGAHPSGTCAHLPTAKAGSKHGAPLLVGIHGASCSAYYFDYSPEYTASLYSDMCGVPFVAFNRPNYLDSSGWQIDRSSAVPKKPGFDKEDGLSHFQEEAKWLQCYILPALWKAFGVPNDCTSIVTLSHSMSVPMTIIAAARYSEQPETERQFPWAGIAIYGYSEVHTQHCNDRSASAASNPHREPDEIPLGQDDRFHIPCFPPEDRADLLCGPRGYEPDQTMRNTIGRNATPFLISETVEMDSWGVPDKSQYKSAVRIPVMYGHPEYDWVWQGSKRNIDAFLKDFTNAPRVEGAVIQAPKNPPFRAEHLGSLKRPDNLLAARKDVHEHKADQDSLPAIEDQAIKDVVKIQEKCGFHAVSDGEYRRHMFWGTFFPSLKGFTEIQGPDADIFRPYVPDIAAFLEADHVPGETVICTGKIEHTGKSSYIEQFEYMKSIVPKEQWGNIKLTLAAPNWYHLRYKTGKAYPKEVYANDQEYFADIAKAYKTELQILYDAGLRNAQVDDPNLAYFCSEKMLDGWAADKSNTQTADELFDAYIAFYNSCFQRPSDMHLGIHLCRGNFVNSRHFSEGGYDRIATKLFQNLNVSTYYLEYDTPRAGGFEPLKHLPKDKFVVLGVVTSKFPKLENKKEMVDRVLQAADFVAQGSGESREQALQRIGVSPQCGFASHSEGNLLTYDDMVEKLKLVRAIADEIWPGEP
ncbi:5-methyltetrahydropteroyltriglutamate-homocysteine methyltransferase, partial [Aureobasidium melanogenum]